MLYRVGIFVALGCCLAASARAAFSEQCDVDLIQAMAPKDVTVSFAARVGVGCQVNGYVTTRDPGPNKVMFVLSLPDRFNGRYVYLGVGGAAGRLPDLPETLQAQGYVLAGSDAGTGAKTSADFSFQSDPAKEVDFLWRGVKVSANATQQITRKYYERDKIYRYISGCSGGGQMGLGNARRFGNEDFDGFLVGATPFPATLYMPNVYRIARHLQLHPESWIPPELMARADKAILAAYDATDGAMDGIIHDQRNIERFDPKILRAVGFTVAQIELFDLIRLPSRYPAPGLRGDGVQPGYAITSVSGWSNFLLGRTAPPWPNTASMSPVEVVASGAPFIHTMADTRTRGEVPGLDYATLDDPKEQVRIASRDGKEIPFEDPMDFTALSKSGAKMIFWHGVNDEAMSYLETLAAGEAIYERFPDAGSWLKIYTIPGLFHCRGGNGPTDFVEALLDALVTWVEKDQPPGAIEAHRYSKNAGLERDFVLCPEPKRSTLKKTGADPKDAASWECR